MLKKHLLQTDYNNNYFLYANEFIKNKLSFKNNLNKKKDSLFILFYNNDSFYINYNVKLLKKYVDKNISIYLVDGNNKKTLNNLLKQKSEEYKFNYIKLPENLLFINNEKIYSLMLNLDFLYKSINEIFKPIKFCIMLQECFIINNNFNNLFNSVNNILYGIINYSKFDKNKWCLSPDFIIFNNFNYSDTFSYFNWKYEYHGLSFTGDSFDEIFNKLNKHDFIQPVNCFKYNYKSLYQSNLNFYELYSDFLIKRTNYYNENRYIKNKKNKYFIKLLNKFL